MKNGTVVVLAFALSLTAGLAVAGGKSGTNTGKQTSQAAIGSKAHANALHSIGTVDSLTANELILDHLWRGVEEQTTFTLNSNTKKEGRIEKGEHVIVYYHVEKGHRIATDLKASVAKLKTGTTKT